MAIKDLSDGDRFDGVLVVKSMSVREAKNGKEYIRTELGDASGSVTAMLWESSPDLISLYGAGNALRVVATVEDHERWGRQLKILDATIAQEDEYDPGELHEGPTASAAELETQLRELIATVTDPHLSALLDSLIGKNAPTWPAYRDAPAAKRFHQAYRHGLLEHCLTVGQSVAAVSGNFPGVNRDLAVTGGLLHDIGKIDAYNDSPSAIDFTDDGRLQGEIPMGYFRIRTAVEAIDGFPDELARGLLHIILSHHGKLEHGSPVVPQTREATVVHMIDHLGGQLGSFDRLERTVSDDGGWSDWDSAIGGSAWFPPKGG